MKIMDGLKHLYWRGYSLATNWVFKGKRIPTYSKLLRIWAVETVDGVQDGSLDYALSEFCASGASYRFHTRAMDAYHYHDHEHGFDAVAMAAAEDPIGFSYHDFEADYSAQELAVLDQVIEAATVAPDPMRWQGMRLPEHISGAILNAENFIGRVELLRDYDQLFRQLQSPIAYSRHGHILIIPDPNPSPKWRQFDRVVAFGEKLKIPGEFVLFLHCDDPDAEVLNVSELSAEELVKVIANVSIKGKPAEVFDWVAHGVVRYQTTFAPLSLQYRFRIKSVLQTVASFHDVEERIVQAPEHFSITGFEADYSTQERAFVLAILRQYQVVKQPDRWQGFAMPETLHGMALDLYDATLNKMTVATDQYVGFRHIAAPFEWYQHEHILILPDPQTGLTLDRSKTVIVFGQNIAVPGDVVYFMHVEEWQATPKIVSDLSAEEIAMVRKSVSINGKTDLPPRAPQPMFLDQYGKDQPSQR